VALDWSVVKPEHVTKAGELLVAQLGSRQPKTTGLLVVVGDSALPAKGVLRLAYSLANGIPVDSVPKFASGDGTLKVLEKLGFRVKRVPASTAPNP
jgi:hypothetical protein